MHWMETTKYGVEYGYMLNKAGVVSCLFLSIVVVAPAFDQMLRNLPSDYNLGIVF